MIEPVKMADFFITFFSAASVIVFGALYALLFAYASIKKVPRVMPLAYAAYVVLFASVIELANVAHLFGSLFWICVVLLMLAGYLFAPHAILRLCRGTHEEAVITACLSPASSESSSSEIHPSSRETAS